MVPAIPGFLTILSCLRKATDQSFFLLGLVGYESGMI
jgi:hypothetical protein